MRSFNPRSAAPLQDNTGKASAPIAQNDSQLNSDPTDQSATNRNSPTHTLSTIPASQHKKLLRCVKMRTNVYKSHKTASPAKSSHTASGIAFVTELMTARSFLESSG